ncbi:unnamed protein product, partial [Heterosigma akashiwo]
ADSLGSIDLFLDSNGVETPHISRRNLFGLIGQEEEKKKNCKGEHGLEPFPTPIDGWYCSGCFEKTGAQTGVPKDTIFYGCRQCNYDLCVSCMDPPPPPGGGEEEEGPSAPNAPP